MYNPSRFVGVDSETHLTQAGLQAPPMVCVSIHAGESEVYDATTGIDLVSQHLKSDAIIVTAYGSYDFVCVANERPALLPDIFKAYDEGRVYDVAIGEQLNAIGSGDLGIDPRTGRPIKPQPGKKKGGYGLDYCVSLRLGREDAKRNDFWRTRYAILQRLPMSLWPEIARQYPKDDVQNPVEVATRQVELWDRDEFMNLNNMREQVDTDFCLRLGSCWGLRTDRNRYEKLKAMVLETRAATIAQFQALGFVKPDEKENEPAIKRAVAIAYGVDPQSKCPRCDGSGKVISGKSGKPINCKVVQGGEFGDEGCDSTGLDLNTAPSLPRTATGGVSASRDTLVESGDEDLMALSQNEGEKLYSTYLPYIATGLDVPITPRANVLLESGRTSYDGVIQQLPKYVLCLYCKGRKCDRCNGKGKVSGVRECHRARPGYVYCSTDYGAQELCALAQVCLWTVGESRMSEVINSTGDPGLLHAAFAANLLGRSFDETVALIKIKDAQAMQARQGAKAGNFGFGGGMGSAKLVLNKRDKREGITYAPNGTPYPGIRFCILLGGASCCGVQKVTEWKGRSYPPICLECVKLVEGDLRPKWFKQWPEIKKYHAWCNNLFDESSPAPCFRPCWECQGQRCAACEYKGWTVERWRGGITSFSEFANNGFQALGADGSKRAYRRLTRECYLDRESPLWGTRPLFLWHDEVISEMPIVNSHLGGFRQATIMVEEMRVYVPDVAVKAEPALMYYMCKDAEAKFDDTGKLVPWDQLDEVA